MRRHATRVSSLCSSLTLVAGITLGGSPAWADPVCADPQPADPSPRIDPSSTLLDDLTVYYFTPGISTCVGIDAATTDILVEVVNSSGAAAQMVALTSSAYSTTTASGGSTSPGNQYGALVLHPAGSGTWAAEHEFALPLAVATGAYSGSLSVRMTLRAGGEVIRVISTETATIQ